MQNDMVQVRDQPLPAHRKQAHRILKAFVVPFQFFPACPEDRIVPVTEKLNDQPEKQHRKQDPFPGGLKKVIRKQPDAVQTEHKAFGAFDPHAFNQEDLPEPLGRYGA